MNPSLPEIGALIPEGERIDPAFCKSYLAHLKAWFEERLKEKMRARNLVHLYASLIDPLVGKLFDSAKAECDLRFYSPGQGVALVALGGYGRQELNLHSDIDLTFLYDWKINPYIEALSERIFYLLWDAGFDVSFSTRTVEDCVKIIRENFASRTALVDARFLTGSPDLYAAFQRAVFVDTFYKNARAFVEEKAEAACTRHAKYGGSIYLLEPNIKQGKGGLRDIHTALWICKVKFKAKTFLEAMKKGVITKKELKGLQASQEFLLQVRNYLHLLSGRKNDHLTFEHQEAIAGLIGYQESHRLLAVEAFMRGYYRHADNVSQFLERVLERARGYLTPASKGFARLPYRDIGDGFRIYKGELFPARLSVFKEAPARLMRAFQYGRDHQAKFSSSLKELIRDSLKLIDNDFRRSVEVNRAFFKLLTPARDTYEILKNMHGLKILGRFIPEFGRVECQVQYDVYHIYTVDTHLLFTVKELSSFLSGEEEDDTSLPFHPGQEIRRPELLLLAGLLHDVGKGKGKGHASLGARLIKNIGLRMGLKPADVKLLQFLLENHLLISNLAQMRDLSDQKLIIEFAKAVQEEEVLKMLYLLALADLKSVGPAALTNWKGSLIEDLYLKVAEVLERGDLRGKLAQERLVQMRQEIISLLKGEYATLELEKELAEMSPRYLMAFTPLEIANHIKMRHKLAGELFLTEVTHDLKNNYSKFTICTHDRVGLFAQISGVMAANNVNILAAQINTSRDGIALDLFLVNDSLGQAVADEGKWSQIHSHLEGVLSGRFNLAELVANRARPSTLPTRKVPRFPPQVFIDNQVSGQYTVIDVYAHDRIGLLYDIARTLASLDLTIDFSKIGTKVDQAVDIFYVKDKNGGKVEEPHRLDEIRSALLKVIQ